MTIHNCYAIHDRKALTYGPPYYAPTKGMAVRSLADLVADTNTTVGRHPADFVLYLVGTYDDQTGILEPVAPLVHVIDAIALVPPPQAELFPGQPIPGGEPEVVNLDRRR